MKKKETSGFKWIVIIALGIILALFLLFGGCAVLLGGTVGVSKYNEISKELGESSLDSPPKRKDCFESHGACLKILQSSYRHDPIGSYDHYEIIGEIQNIGSKKNDYNPWHAVEGYCYENDIIIDTGSDTPPLLNPNEKGVFKIGVDGHGRKIDSCKVKIRY